MSSFYSGFNPVYFLYLNPKLCVDNSIFTVEEAIDYWRDNSNTMSSILSNMDLIPQGFDPQTYLSKIKANANFSQVNSNIYTMLLRDYDVVDIVNKGAFFPNIQETVISKGSNVYSLDVYGTTSNISITSNILSTGDIVKLSVDGVPLCSVVTSVVSTTDFTLDSNITIPIDKTMMLHGIKLFDIERVAHVNYLTFYQSNIPILTTIDSNFNPDLYKLLYPDVAIFTNDQAYDDYLARDGTRIGSVYDFETFPGGGSSVIGEQGSNISTLTITSNLNLSFNSFQGKFTWAGTELYYVTTDHTRALSDVSPYIHGLASEYALKKWTYDLLWPSAQFSNAEFSNVIISPSGNLDVQTISSSNLSINGVTTFESNVEFQENVEFISNVTVRENLYGGRIGIGATTTSDEFRTIESNIQAQNASIEDTLYVGNNAQFDGNIYGSNVLLKGDLKCASRIGIGPVTFESFSADWSVDGQYSLPANLQTFNIPGSAVISGDVQVSGDMLINDISVSSSVTASTINVTDEINALKNISTLAYVSAEDIMIRENTDIVAMLYDTSIQLGIPYEFVTTQRIVTAFAGPALLCQTDMVNIIYCTAPENADFIILDNGQSYRINSIQPGIIAVQTNTLPLEVKIKKFTIVDEDAILVGEFLSELTKQLNAISYKLS
jgi:hypothetical protein